MNKQYYLLFFLIFYSPYAFAQSTYIERAELGISLFSITNEKESDRIEREGRIPYGGILNGYIFKYHKQKFSFRIHLRIIGVQGGGLNSSNAPDLGNNYEDVGFQLGTGLEKRIAKNKRWEWYMGLELTFMRGKEADFFSGIKRNDTFYHAYTMGGLNLINGFKLKASRHFSFIWETNHIVGMLYQKTRFSSEPKWLGQGYSNPVGIFGVTISWNKEK